MDWGVVLRMLKLIPFFIDITTWIEILALKCKRLDQSAHSHTPGCLRTLPGNIAVDPTDIAECPWSACLEMSTKVSRFQSRGYYKLISQIHFPSWSLSATMYLYSPISCYIKEWSSYQNQFVFKGINARELVSTVWIYLYLPPVCSP